MLDPERTEFLAEGSKKVLKFNLEGEVLEQKSQFVTHSSLSPRLRKCKLVKKNYWRPNKTDITFAAFGDTQFGSTAERKFKGNKFMVNALNLLTTKKWPKRMKSIKKSVHGQRVNGIRGVLIAGDLTDNNINTYFNKGTSAKQEMRSFVSNYNVCGSRQPNQANYPIYEGYGNHAFEFQKNFNYIQSNIKMINIRNKYRRDLTSTHTHGHYS